MAGRSFGKPYDQTTRWATEADPEIKKELISLPKMVQEAIIPFLRSGTTLDSLHEMELICLEEMHKPNTKALSHARERIRDHFKEESSKRRILYNSRNISLNQCFGESKTPVSEWLDVTGWREWDDR